ncbi:MAG: TIGR03118 family protein [Isosphaeraceae bacterium]
MRHFNYAMVALGGLALLASLPTAARAGFFQQSNLVTDPGSGITAPNTDPTLINPWGISFSTTGPFWVSDQGTQKATLYNGAGVPQSLGGNIPPSGTFGPTGQVFNNTNGFIIPSDGNPAAFIFANLNGSISAWNGGLGTAPGVTAQVVAQPPPGGASFTGLALVTNTVGSFLYAADKGNNTIDVFDSHFVLRSILTDPNGLTPYNIQLLSDGRLYVTFENKTNPNVGAVEILNNGIFQPLIPSTDTHLKEPWGLALAPSTFGPFGGDLLVGNKRDGTINAFNPTTGAFVGTLTDASGNPIADPGLWGLAFRQTGSGFDPNALYFAAGVGFLGGQGNDIYAHGLFGSISFVPEPASAILLGLGMVVLCGVCHWGSRRRQRGSAPGKEGAIHVP